MSMSKLYIAYNSSFRNSNALLPFLLFCQLVRGQPRLEAPFRLSSVKEKPLSLPPLNFPLYTVWQVLI